MVHGLEQVVEEGSQSDVEPRLDETSRNAQAEQRLMREDTICCNGGIIRHEQALKKKSLRIDVRKKRK